MHCRNIFPNRSSEHNCFNTSYSGTPPYGHLSNMVTSLLRALFFGRLAKIAIHFLLEKPSLIRPNFFGPLVTVLMGLHCKTVIKTSGYKSQKFLTEAVFLRLCSNNFNSFCRYHICVYSKLPNGLLGLSGCSSKFQNSGKTRKAAIIGVSNSQMTLCHLSSIKCQEESGLLHANPPVSSDQNDEDPK